MTDVACWARVIIVAPDGTRRVQLLAGPGAPDLAVVNELARLQLAARRAGCRVRLEDVCAALAELLELAGLRREAGGLRREAGGQAEGREELAGLQERVDPGDPAG